MTTRKTEVGQFLIWSSLLSTWKRYIILRLIVIWSGSIWYFSTNSNRSWSLLFYGVGQLLPQTSPCNRRDLKFLTTLMHNSCKHETLNIWSKTGSSKMDIMILLQWAAFYLFELAPHGHPNKTYSQHFYTIHYSLYNVALVTYDFRISCSRNKTGSSKMALMILLLWAALY